MNINSIITDEIILSALREDVGTGDITTNTTISEDKTVFGKFIAKDNGIICGLEVCERVFKILDENIEFTAIKKDGEAVKYNDIIATVSGNARNVLTAERTAINLLQRMSGIATETAKAVEQIAGTKAKIADTRKTTPGLRVFEKYAVKTGGGTNHRFNLSDGILIKDNHIAAAGGIINAVKSARANAPHTLKIEVECENMKDVEDAIIAKADIIMLDNMTNEDMKKAVGYINGRAVTEASGNMGDKDLRAAAETGVDIISIGALTHSVKSLDISLKFVLSELSLVIPTLEHKRDAMEYRQEWIDKEPGESIHGSWGFQRPEYENYETWLTVIENLKTGQNNNPNINNVPATTYFCFCDGKIVGNIQVRHYLNDYLFKQGGHIGYSVRPSERCKGYATKMLALALDECKKLGITKALLTCDKNNIGSARTIQKNGGVLENEIIIDDGEIMQRYWIDTISPNKS